MDLGLDAFRKEMGELAGKINYRPDTVVGILRGGRKPAEELYSRLNAGNLYFLAVKKYGEERRVTTEIIDNLSGRNVILVEDMLETGRSMIVAKEYLERKGARIKTACLYTMQQSEIIPDFYLRQVEEPVHFFWE